MLEKEFLNLKEASETLGIDPRTMKKIMYSEGFKYTRLGRKVLINKAEMIKFLESHKIIRY